MEKIKAGIIGCGRISSVYQAAFENKMCIRDRLSVDEWAGEERIAEIETFAKRVRDEGDILVVIGIGGSNQAARAVTCALPNQSKVKVLYAGNNISSAYMKQILAQLDGKSVYINVIAKNFETMEPGIGFRILRQYLRKRYGADYKSRVFATGTRGSELEALCVAHGYTFLDFPEDIGGRYSACLLYTSRCV